MLLNYYLEVFKMFAFYFSLTIGVAFNSLLEKSKFSVHLLAGTINVYTMFNVLQERNAGSLSLNAIMISTL